MTRGTTVLVAVAISVLNGCGSELPGFFWQVDVSAAVSGDGCNSPGVDYSESFEYRMVEDGAGIELYIGEFLMATGTIAGCDIQYLSTTWSDPRPTGDLRWRIDGDASINRDDACSTATDWDGFEVIEIVASDDPEIDAGCLYTTDVTGTYLGEVQ